MTGQVSRYCLSVVLLYGGVGGGCSAGFPWPGGGRARRSPHETPAGSSRPSRAAERTAQSPSSDGTLHVVEVAFNLLRAELPVESIRHSKKVWNHVDELRVDPEMSARLARNSLRVGAASAKAWPALRTILTACNARVYHEQLLARPGLPISIDLGQIPDSESIFFFDADNRLVGKTFPDGSKLLNLDYAVRPELGGYVDLGLSLEVRRERDTITWQRHGGIIRQEPAYDRHVFADLSVLLPLHEGESLVIGPGDTENNPYLIGQRFLLGERGDSKYEMLLIITPVPYQTNRRRAAAP